jgi:hypothetical protein
MNISRRTQIGYVSALFVLYIWSNEVFGPDFVGYSAWITLTQYLLHQRLNEYFKAVISASTVNRASSAPDERPFRFSAVECMA